MACLPYLLWYSQLAARLNLCRNRFNRFHNIPPCFKFLNSEYQNLELLASRIICCVLAIFYRFKLASIKTWEMFPLPPFNSRSLTLFTSDPIYLIPISYKVFHYLV